MIRDRTYYCGWAITYRDSLSHLIVSRDFPTAGSLSRAWCGETVIVVGLTLDARRLRLHCPECNGRLQQIATRDALPVHR